MVSQVHKGHGRIKRRTIIVSTELIDYLDWPYVAQVFRLEREVWHDLHRGRTRQVVYGLTSLTPPASITKKVAGFDPPVLGHRE
jgi:hypothetical protein